jgi:hypothetical protein
MNYITSRSFKLPQNKTELENSDWFNMWNSRQFPYKELLIGDILYWYDSTYRAIVWKTKVVDIIRFPYHNKKEILEKFKDVSNEKYFQSRADKGFFINYKIQVLESVKFPKPENFSFPQLGWTRIDNEQMLKWVNENDFSENNTLDNISPDKLNLALQQLLSDLNEKMKYVSPERVNKLISATIRKDSQIIRKLKELSDYKCQFPGCNHRIKMKNGGYYVEVAHIKPVSTGGQSILGNLLVLCPNHHKEFDYGDLKIDEQAITRIHGKLNDMDFEIKLIK